MLCPEVHYRRTEKGICITGCYGTDGDLVLPDKISGEPVTEIGPYAFAHTDSKDPDEIVWMSPNASVAWERHRICAQEVSRIWLPADVNEVGRYAFYRCRNLERLILSDSLREIGGGALTGCRLSQVEIHCFSGNRSCLKSILDEIRFAVCADIFYEQSGDFVKIFFPEHYEEAVENTPARLLVTHHHGAGGYYRQCFYDRELDYKKYDETFFRACAEEDEKVTVELALCRLRYPYKLGKDALEVYSAYIEEHRMAVCRYLIEQEDLDGIRFLADRGYLDTESLSQAIEMAAEMRKTDILSWLMNVRRRQKSTYLKKTFEL